MLNSPEFPLPTFRIGQGQDIHRLVPGRRLILGGVEIPHPQGLGLLGHSDADVLLHAVIDALLGALALGDIGQLFPDSDNAWRDADSQKLLQQVLDLPSLRSCALLNLDCTITAEQPRLAPHISAIRSSLANLLQTDIRRISVKAKTNEQLDAIGRGEAIAATAIALLWTPEATP
jgi:2-C-methyl-D-erythritol 2,4-cyclodiphosphate synthase